MSDELKPCPFCGGTYIEDDVYTRDGRVVVCHGCRAGITRFNPNGNERAIEAWNTRTPSPHHISMGLPQDVINLVIAAREAFDTGMLHADESQAMDKALESFSSRVPYENDPETDYSKPASNYNPAEQVIGNYQAPAELSVGAIALQKLLKLIDAMPRTDRGFSWEARDWQGNEAIRAYGENAAVLKFILDNTDKIAADLRAALSSPMGGVE